MSPGTLCPLLHGLENKGYVRSRQPNGSDELVGAACLSDDIRPEELTSHQRHIVETDKGVSDRSDLARWHININRNILIVANSHAFGGYSCPRTIVSNYRQRQSGQFMR